MPLKTDTSLKYTFDLQALEYYFEICKSLPNELLTHMNKGRLFSIMKNANKNMEDLKKCIASTMKSQRHWGEDVPITWTKLESALKRLKEDKKIYLFSDLLRDVKNSNDFNINDEEKLNNALEFFHETGVILFSSETENIILDVQWFVDAFKCIILDKEHKDSKDEKNLPEFQELYENGLLSKSLLNQLWEKGNFNQHKKSLIYHMKQLDMLAELSTEEWYVPCMNKHAYSHEILKNCNVSSRLCFLFQFLPFIVYHRLVVACINKLDMELWEREGRKCVFHTVTILLYKDSKHRMLIGICDNKGRLNTEYPYSIEIQANVTYPHEVDTQLTSDLRIRICKILYNLTRAFSSGESSFSVGYRCQLEPFGGNLEGQIVKEEKLSGLEFVCSKCTTNHVANVESIRRFWEVIIVKCLPVVPCLYITLQMYLEYMNC